MPIQQYDDDLSPISTGLSRLVDWIYPRDLNTRYKLREMNRSERTYAQKHTIIFAIFARPNSPERIFPDPAVNSSQTILQLGHQLGLHRGISTSAFNDRHRCSLIPSQHAQRVHPAESESAVELVPQMPGVAWSQIFPENRR